MIKCIALILGTIVANTSVPATNRDATATKQFRRMSGFLNAHWEYPGLIPDKSTGLSYMDFQLSAKDLDKLYRQPVSRNYVGRPGEDLCFRIVGEGFLSSRPPTHMQPWEGSRFVFVKVKKLRRVAGSECASRIKALGS